MALIDMSAEWEYIYPNLRFDKRFPADGNNSNGNEPRKLQGYFKQKCVIEYEECSAHIANYCDCGMDSIKVFKELYNAYNRCDLDMFNYVFEALHANSVISEADYFFFRFAQEMDKVGLNEYNMSEKLDSAKNKFSELFLSIPPEIFSKVVMLMNRFGYLTIIQPRVIEFPKGVKYIDSQCFSGSNFKFDFLYRYSSITDVIFPDTVDIIEESAFKDCKLLERVRLSDNIESIPQNCFSRCVSLHDINLPLQLKAIGESAFYDCAVTRLDIPEGVTEIGDYAFEGCKQLEFVSLPTSLKRLGKGAFSGCSKLKNFELSPDNKHFAVKDGVLFSCDLTELISYPSGKEDIIYSVPDETETIFDCAFRRARNLESVDLSSVRKIGESAFAASALKSVFLPQSVEEVGGSAFYCCEKLATVTLSDKMREIPESCFDLCTSLNSIEIPDGIEKIAKSAFESCDSLQQLIVPDSVTEVGEDALGFCDKLTYVSLSQNLKRIPQFFCHPNPGVCRTVVVIPDGVNELEEYSLSRDVIIVCKQGSAAHKYAVANNNEIRLL